MAWHDPCYCMIYASVEWHGNCYCNIYAGMDLALAGILGQKQELCQVYSWLASCMGAYG